MTLKTHFNNNKCNARSEIIRGIASARGAMGRGIDPSYCTHWAYFSFQPVLHDWCKCLWDGAYKRTLPASQKE